MSIDFQRKDYVARRSEWDRIDHVVSGKDVDRYLVSLNPQDKSEENRDRNEQYRKRAIFYAISGQTVRGMVGSIFRKWPRIETPDEMEYLQESADGAGVSIYQQSQEVSEQVLMKGRAGVAVSFPQTEGQVSRADLTNGRVVATIHSFRPEQIINWRTERDGARVKMSLVVIMETDEVVADDGYTLEEVEVIREMYMDYIRDEEGNAIGSAQHYKERIWRKGDNGWQIWDEYMPLDASGNPWDEIPFTFVGAQNNDPTPDDAPMLGIVELNIGHYRNSADYEDSVFYVGQAQPWMSGITQDHIDLMRENNMYVGSRQMLGVPDGESFNFAQAGENSMVRQAMQDKVEMMIGLGARMMSTGSATKTASQVHGEREGQTSVLAMVASNVSEAYTKALTWVARYMGTSEEDLSYTLNQEFLALTAEPQMAQAVMMGFMQGQIPLPDYVRWMKRADLFDDETPVEDYADLLARQTFE